LSGRSEEDCEKPVRIAGVLNETETEQNLGFHDAKSTYRRKSIDLERLAQDSEHRRI
jgi:hypothetical protein